MIEANNITTSQSSDVGDEAAPIRSNRRRSMDSNLGRRHYLLSNRFENMIRNHIESKRRPKNDDNTTTTVSATNKNKETSSDLKYSQTEYIDDLKTELEKRFQSIVALENALEAQRLTMEIMSATESKYKAEINDLKEELEKRADSIADFENTVEMQRDTISQLQRKQHQQQQQQAGGSSSSKQRTTTLSSNREELHHNLNKKERRSVRSRRRDQQKDKNETQLSDSLRSNYDDVLRECWRKDQEEDLRKLGHEGILRECRRKAQQNDTRRLSDSSRDLESNTDDINRASSAEKAHSKDKNRKKSHDNRKLRTFDRSMSEPRIRSTDHDIDVEPTKSYRSKRIGHQYERKEDAPLRRQGNSRSLLPRDATHSSRPGLGKQRSCPSSLRRKRRPCANNNSNVEGAEFLSVDDSNSSKEIIESDEQCEDGKHQDTSLQINGDSSNVKDGKQKASRNTNNTVEKTTNIPHRECEPPSTKRVFTPNTPIISNIANMPRKGEQIRKLDGSVYTNPSQISSASSRTPSDHGTMPILSSQETARPDTSCQFQFGSDNTYPVPLIAVGSNTFIERAISSRK
mmetsp:Transcript_16877/g.24978  ORF Transcript_16877/g.24978 Transcript_16877/m.24978 type:complete len:573 (+) Transcript_16877:127-1845(+)